MAFSPGSHALFCSKWVIFGILTLQKKERLSRGLDVKWNIPSTCLAASKKWFSTGIYSIKRASEWLWPETQETPQNGQNVHGFQVRTPICHIVPVSRAYGGGDFVIRNSAPITSTRDQKTRTVSTCLILVHRITAFVFAFVFAFAMAIPRCQWRYLKHRAQ